VLVANNIKCVHPLDSTVRLCSFRQEVSALWWGWIAHLLS
jgi:hypothetical protein